MTLTADTTEPDFDPGVLQRLPMVADGSDPGYADELLTLFEQCGQRDVDQMRQAVAQGDDALARRLVHTLKSTAGQVGALALAAEATRQDAALRGGQAAQPQWPARLQQRLDAFCQARRQRASSLAAQAHPVDRTPRQAPA